MKKKFCTAPFTTLIINADGKVGCCRERGTEFSIGNALTQTIEEIWNGDEIKKWRREFLDGNIVTCKREQADMSCNLFKHNMELMHEVEFSEHQSHPVLRLSPDINGQCNLKCPMCIVWKKPNGQYDEIPNFWENLEANVLPNLKIMDPLAGEPFIQEDLYKIIRLTAKVNPDCRWNFTTNGQWELNEYIKQHLDMIKIDLISISVDSVIFDTYKKIRLGGNLQDLFRNILKIKNYIDERNNNNIDKTNLMLNFTIQKQNAYELESIFDFSNKINLNALLLFLYEPIALSLESWTDEEKKKYLKFYFEKLEKRDLIRCNRIFMALIRSMVDKALSSKLLQVYNFLTDGQIKSFINNTENPFQLLNQMGN